MGGESKKVLFLIHLCVQGLVGRAAERKKRKNGGFRRVKGKERTAGKR